jgi:hypothetical protein
VVSFFEGSTGADTGTREAEDFVVVAAFERAKGARYLATEGSAIGAAFAGVVGGEPADVRESLE